jgi:radical SAM superfamily enzyme YgiQ (UPF0313 family)
MMVIPTAITSMSAHLKERGVEVDLFDTTFYKIMEKSADEMRVEICQNKPFKFSDADVGYKTTDMHQDFVNKLEDFKPDVLAISCNDFTHKIAESLIENIHDRYPELHIIMGGIYPTFFPEHAIANPDVDSICIGEGYEALYELCQIIEKQQGNKVYNIKNLWVKDATYPNNIHKNPMRPPIDINTIPFDDFDLFEPKRHYRPMFGKMLKILPFWFDIGCPYNCTYCSAPQLKRIYKEGGHKYGRVKNIDRIKEELTYQINKHKPEFIYFSSETFFARSDEHVKEFAEFYKQFNIPFWCEARSENITEENTAILKEMGCSRISIGLESGNEEYRMNILNKRFTNDQFLRSANILKLNGIKFTTNNIIGLPDETREMVFDTIELNRQITNWSNDVNQVISTYVPTGGTDLQKYCLEKGYFNLDEYLNMPYGGFHISIYLNMPQLPPKDVVGLLRTFPMYVRFDKDRWDEIKLAETDDMVYKNLMVEYWNNLR